MITKLVDVVGEAYKWLKMADEWDIYDSEYKELKDNPPVSMHDRATLIYKYLKQLEELGENPIVMTNVERVVNMSYAAPYVEDASQDESIVRASMLWHYRRNCLIAKLRLLLKVEYQNDQDPISTAESP